MIIKRLFRGIAVSWLMFGIALLFLVLLEFIAHVILKTESKIEARHYTIQLVKEYEQDLSSLTLEWYSYSYWRTRSTQLKHFHIDQNGLRYTLNHPKPSKLTFRIFMFGGSALWGFGSREINTIPSILSELLSKQTNLNIEIVNFGQIGYVSTQEFITLLREMQNGNSPDVAVFYDGANDVFTAFQNHQAGLSESEENRRREFNLLKPWREMDLLKESLRALVQNSSSYQLVTGKKITPYKVMQTMLGADEARPCCPAELTQSVIRSYDHLVSFAHSMTNKSGPHLLFYWQPVVFTKNPLTSDEKQKEQSMLKVKQFYVDVYYGIEHDPFLLEAKFFHNLSHQLDRNNQTFFFDYCHVTEDANRIIAAAMLPDLLALVKAREKKVSR